MSDTDEDKPHEPTEKKKKKALEEGQLIRSKEYASFLVLILGLLMLFFYSAALLVELKKLTQEVLWSLEEKAEAFDRLDNVVWQPLWTLVHCLLAIFIGFSVLSPLVGGFHFEIGWIK